MEPDGYCACAQGAISTKTQKENLAHQWPVQEGGNFCAKSNSLWEISRSPLVECITPRQSPQCVPLVCEKFTENPEFRCGKFRGAP